MLDNSKEMCSRYWRFYDSSVLLTVARLTSAKHQGAAENPVFFYYKLSLGTLWTKLHKQNISHYKVSKHETSRVYEWYFSTITLFLYRMYAALQWQGS
jgi:hypothetical protein